MIFVRRIIIWCSSIMHGTQSKDAKDAKCCVVFVKDFLCALSATAPCVALTPASMQSWVFAVNMVFVDKH